MKTSCKGDPQLQKIVNSISHRAGILLVIISTSFTIIALKNIPTNHISLQFVCIYLKRFTPAAQ